RGPALGPTRARQLPEVEDQETPLDRSVPERYPPRAQTELLAEPLVGRHDDRLPAAIAVLEQVAQPAPGVDLRFEADSVRRVDRDQAGRGGGLELEVVPGREDRVRREA